MNSILSKLWSNWGQRKLPFRSRQTTLSFILLVSIGLTLAVSFPVLSQDQASDQTKMSIQPANLAQQGKQYYEAGKLDQAIETWQQATVAYGDAGNEAGKRESFLNMATAEQALGLYEQSCDSLLEAFNLAGKTNCSLIIEEAQVVEPQLSGIVPKTKAAEARLLPAVEAINH